MDPAATSIYQLLACDLNRSELGKGRDALHGADRVKDSQDEGVACAMLKELLERLGAFSSPGMVEL